MEAPPQTCYLVFIKRRSFNKLCETAAGKQWSPWQKKPPHNFHNRIELDAILVGEYTSYNYMLDFVCGCIPCLADHFLFHKSFTTSVHNMGINLIARYNYTQAKELQSSRKPILNEIYLPFTYIELNQDELPEIMEEAEESLEFLLEIAGLLRSRKYWLIVISTSKQIRFKKFIPAHVC